MFITRFGPDYHVLSRNSMPSLDKLVGGDNATRESPYCGRNLNLAAATPAFVEAYPRRQRPHRC